VQSPTETTRLLDQSTYLSPSCIRFDTVSAFHAVGVYRNDKPDESKYGRDATIGKDKHCKGEARKIDCPEAVEAGRRST
jgi:hypothetical protein